MIYMLAILFIISTALGQPIDTVKTELNPPTDEVVYIPYAFKYVPVEYPVHKEKPSNNEESNSILKRENEEKPLTSENGGTEDVKILPPAELEDALNKVSISINDNENSKKQSSKAKESTIDHFEEAGLSKSSEDYVLVPISVLNKLAESSSLSGTHVVNKRQAPGRRISRRPALVGYLNDYDFFPTVA